MRKISFRNFNNYTKEGVGESERVYVYVREGIIDSKASPRGPANYSKSF